MGLSPGSASPLSTSRHDDVLSEAQGLLGVRLDRFGAAVADDKEEEGRRREEDVQQAGSRKAVAVDIIC